VVFPDFDPLTKPQRKICQSLDRYETNAMAGHTAISALADARQWDGLPRPSLLPLEALVDFDENESGGLVRGPARLPVKSGDIAVGAGLEKLLELAISLDRAKDSPSVTSGSIRQGPRNR
jgi:hypothetical protein